MRFFKVFFLIILMLLAVVGGGVWRVWSSIPGRGLFSGDVSESSSHRLRFDPELGTINVLLIGLDEVDGGRRADAIALAIFDQENQSVRISPIPRDTRVQIKDRGWEKINHAYAYGGVDLLKQTVESLSGLEINYFVVVNYQGFPRIIDLLGGVDIDVEKNLVYKDFSAKLFINISKGPQHMDGKTALEYVRFRHDPLGDIGRVQRQQKFIAIVMDKLKSPSVIPKIPALVGEAIAALNTDLTPRQAIELAQFATSLPSERVEFYMAPGKAAYIGNLSYWIVDVRQWSIWLASGKREPAPKGVSDDVVGPVREETPNLVARIGKIGILNGDGASGLGKRAAQVFQKAGIDVAYTGNAKHFDYHSSSVIYPENATESDKQAAEALAKLCGITDRALIKRTSAATMVSVILGHDKEAIFKRLESSGFSGKVEE